MAWSTNGTGSEFAAGHTPLTNPARSNTNSLTLNDSAASDQGLDATSAKWNSMTGQVATSPHSVLQPYSFSRSPTNGSDGANTLPDGTFLGTANGQSADNFNKALMLRYAGGGSDNIP